MKTASHAARITGIVIFLTSLMVVFGMLIGLLVYREYVYKDSPGAYENFAKCLTKNGVVFAGVRWCEDCKKTIEHFGPAFEEVTFKNCDIEKTYCLENGVTSYPVWIFKGDKRKEGFLEFEELAELSGCRIN